LNRSLILARAAQFSVRDDKRFNALESADGIDLTPEGDMPLSG